MNTKKWTMFDGTKIRIKDMRDRQLLYTIRFIRKEHERLVMEAQQIQMMVQGDIASFYAERDADAALRSEPEDTFPILEDMLDEMRRRDLKELDYSLRGHQLTSARFEPDTNELEWLDLDES